MRQLAGLVVLLCALCAPALGQATQPQSWQYQGPGEWQAATQPAATQPQAAVELDRAQALLDRGRWKQAQEVALQWVLANKSHPERDRGLYLIAEALFGRGDRIKAFYYLDELLDTYPESAYFARALEFQYRIADAYLDGYKRRFMRMQLLSAEEEAIEMLFRIQNRSPGSPLAERALLRTGDHYFAAGDYDFAEDAYGHYLSQYPRSPHVPQVRLRRAFSSWAQFRGPRFDPTPLIDAREQLRTIVVQHPDVAAQENLPQMLRSIDEALARKLNVTADFYRRTGEAQASAMTLQTLVASYPQTDQAQEARQRLAARPPPAPPAEPPSPATAPTQPPSASAQQTAGGP